MYAFVKCPKHLRYRRVENITNRALWFQIGVLSSVIGRYYINMCLHSFGARLLLEDIVNIYPELSDLFPQPLKMPELDTPDIAEIPGNHGSVGIKE